MHESVRSVTSAEREDAARLPAVSPDVVARRLESEVVLVNLRTNRIFALNSTGARFWELLREGLDRFEIEATLCREFDGPADEVSASIDELVAELRVEGLVEDSPRP